MADDVADFILPILRSGYIGEGEQCKEFEKKFGEYIQNGNVVLVNSGTSALIMALKLAEIGYGDMVVSTPMTCLATNMAILSVGADIIWADILPDGTINPKDVEEKLKDFHWKAIYHGINKLMPKAIMCMDWGGMPCKLNELRDIGDIFDIPVIEDACQALGSQYERELIGNCADFVAFSFQSIKQLTSIDGGMLAINDPNLVEKAKMMRWFGLDRNSGADMRCNQDPPVAGYKWQMNDVLASVGLANIRHLSDIIEKTKKHAQYYNDRFGIETDSERESGYWLYTIFVNNVDYFIQYMKGNNIECSKVHDRNDTKTIFKKSRTYLPGVDHFDKHHVCVPVGWWLTDKDVEGIASLVLGYRRKYE